MCSLICQKVAIAFGNALMMCLKQGGGLYSYSDITNHNLFIISMLLVILMVKQNNI